MLAKFENGYFLEVKHDEEDNEYKFTVYDEECDWCDCGWTEYRNIEFYYPMNLIDYIIAFCTPDGVNGKYEILEQKSMDEYEELFKEDPNGDWVLERQGTDYEDIRYYKIEEAARKVMLEEAEEIAENEENSDLDDDYCEVSGEEYYQTWKIYKREIFETEKEKLFDKIDKEFARVDIGISQYAWELQSTYVIRKHVDKLERLIEKLKEMM
jgi:hypothetical protein